MNYIGSDWLISPIATIMTMNTFQTRQEGLNILS